MLSVSSVNSLRVNQCSKLVNQTSFKSNPAVKISQNADEFAVGLLKKEILKTMSLNEADSWVAKVQRICKALNISPKNLPINKDFPGNLTAEQSKKFLNAVLNTVFLN